MKHESVQVQRRVQSAVQPAVRRRPAMRAWSAAVAAATLAAVGAPPAHAGEAEGEFHGYFRAGAGTSAGRGPQACYGLGGNTMKYRLGNECDAYFEGGYTKELARAEGGVSFVGTVWGVAYTPNSDFAGGKVELAKAYIEVKGLDFLRGGVAWIGKRYYFRPDIHMLDLQYINLNGTGGGIDGIKAGPGKVSYAIFKDNDLNTVDPRTGLRTRAVSALRQNLTYEGLPVNPGGTLDAALSLIRAEDKAGHDGWQLSVFHKQTLGGERGWNTVGVQYGAGPGTGIGGPCCARMGASGSTALGSDVTRLRVFDSLVIQPTPQFSTEFIALVQRDRSDAGGSSTWSTLGARPVYAFTRHFKLQGEVGASRVTSPAGGGAMRLTKYTIAPTLTVGPAYYARPELRAFITHARWNKAALLAVNADNNSGPVFGGRTSGTSAGVQLEAWF